MFIYIYDNYNICLNSSKPIYLNDLQAVKVSVTMFKTCQ